MNKYMYIKQVLEVLLEVHKDRFCLIERIEIVLEED